MSMDIVGRKYCTNNGVVEIIAYRSNKDVDIMFEDGTIARHKIMSNIRSGYVSNDIQKQIKRQEKAKSMIGTRILTRNGYGTIIGYNGSKDITVKWDYGITQEHMQMCNIRKMQAYYKRINK